MFLSLLESPEPQYYDKPVEKIPSDGIFVFGSNLAGRHGLGAALTAVKQYGAKYVQGIGLHGKSYAIPTKDRELRVLPLEVIEEYVGGFVRFTQSGEHWFYVTPIGTGLAGYPHHKIAPMFRRARWCWFPAIWRPYIEGVPSCRRS